jgi:hypothetical protein
MGKAQLTLAALLVAGGLSLLVVSLRTPAESVSGAAAQSPTALERRVREAAQRVLEEDGLRGSRLVAVRCDPVVCDVEVAHQDRAALASFQQQFPHRMGSVFAHSSIRSDPATLRSHAHFSRAGAKAERAPR